MASIAIARPVPRRKAKHVATMTASQYERLTIIQQVKRAFGSGARLAGFVGLIIGGFVPAATYTLVHHEVSRYPVLWVLVAGGLLYSATTVFIWARAAFGSVVKSLGFVILLEGILTFSHIEALGLSAVVDNHSRRNPEEWE